MRKRIRNMSQTGLVPRTLCAFAFFTALTLLTPAARSQWAIAIHGGAGESEWEHMDPATAAAYQLSLSKALAAGSAVLEHHGSSLDAVEASVEVLEDDPLFNAGPGAADGYSADTVSRRSGGINERAHDGKSGDRGGGRFRRTKENDSALQRGLDTCRGRLAVLRCSSGYLYALAVSNDGCRSREASAHRSLSDL